MFGALARRLFGSANDRYIKSLGPFVEQINEIAGIALSSDAIDKYPGIRLATIAADPGGLAQLETADTVWPASPSARMKDRIWIAPPVLPASSIPQASAR